MPDTTNTHINNDSWVEVCWPSTIIIVRLLSRYDWFKHSEWSKDNLTIEKLGCLIPLAVGLLDGLSSCSNVDPFQMSYMCVCARERVCVCVCARVHRYRSIVVSYRFGKVEDGTLTKKPIGSGGPVERRRKCWDNKVIIGELRKSVSKGCYWHTS